MQLECTSNYRNGTLSYEKGQDIHVTEAEGEWLLRDSPGSFREVKAPAAESTTTTASDVEAVDRQMRGGRKR
jgi:hypothetical protein